MRISELSRRSGVPGATIKFYLREGLLPPGRATAATQAEYSEVHLRRLRLIRALIGVRGLTVNATREVLTAVSEHEGDLHQVLGLVLGARPVNREEEPQGGLGSSEVNALVEQMGWQVSAHAPARRVIAETLESLRSLGADYSWRTLLPYAELARQTAVLDLDQLEDTDDSVEQAERALLLTVLLEPALLALRRMAQENESAARHGD
ncbi:MerR family transcriptional regulator [Streptacidiphilus melanogenes]|uniref:MerR family transcriptional regulator n=1 Tax=Streptacidiphilus melanogenes TaxID=411235 RepID=UPI0005AAF918|nr:MerR family transcriptional regulator [Streptacidiphilus melanogenes]